ncbi:MAG: hypothetical protein H6825_03210 [Planctomycetes bacterium]|nr:hypothetical protein [Planctomycetota bacterium]
MLLAVAKLPSPLAPWILGALLVLGGWALRDVLRAPDPGPRRPRTSMLVLLTLIVVAAWAARDGHWTERFMPSDSPFGARIDDVEPELRALVESAPRHGSRGLSSHGHAVGRWRILEVASDERGGVFLSTDRHLEVCGNGGVTEGFAFRPNREGTPFGDDGYELEPLGGDWYAFEASERF